MEYIIAHLMHQFSSLRSHLVRWPSAPLLSTVSCPMLSGCDYRPCRDSRGAQRAVSSHCCCLVGWQRMRRCVGKAHIFFCRVGWRDWTVASDKGTRASHSPRKKRLCCSYSCGTARPLSLLVRSSRVLCIFVGRRLLQGGLSPY